MPLAPKNRLRCALLLAGGVGLLACNGGSATAPPAAVPAAPALRRAADVALRHLARFALDSLNPPAPGQPIRFSPYGFVDTARTKSFSPALLAMVAGSEKKVYWADYDGSGAPMDLDVQTYFRRFVRDRDYARADSVLFNRSVRVGNETNNLAAVFPGAEYVEYFCQGTARNRGTDWSALRLVFRQVGGQYVLVGVVHHQWTI